MAASIERSMRGKLETLYTITANSQSVGMMLARWYKDKTITNVNRLNGGQKVYWDA